MVVVRLVVLIVLTRWGQRGVYRVCLGDFSSQYLHHDHSGVLELVAVGNLAGH
jgi:hypothetical protein